MFFFLAATRCQCQGLATDLSIEKSAVAVTIEISLVRCCVRNCRGAAGWKLGVVVMKTWKRFLIETISVQSKIYPCWLSWFELIYLTNLACTSADSGLFFSFHCCFSRMRSEVCSCCLCVRNHRQPCAMRSRYGRAYMGSAAKAVTFEVVWQAWCFVTFEHIS